MVPEFPSSETLLADLLRVNPHTRKGQWEVAARIKTLVDEFALGSVEIFSYDISDGKGEKHAFPMVRILAEYSGSDSGGNSQELVTLLGHIDTIPLSEGQKAGLEIQSKNNITIGRGRGTLDMMGGNVSILRALHLLKLQNASRYAYQVILNSREEDGSEVLWKALRQGDILKSQLGITPEITTFDDGTSSPVYRARTGRIGIDVIFKGASFHAGAIGKDRSRIDRTAHRALGRALDDICDDSPERHFVLPNLFPSDTESILPCQSFPIPGKILGNTRTLNPPGNITQRFHFLTANPDLSPERLRTEFNEYLLQTVGLSPESFSMRLEPRNEGVGFISPYCTPADHPLVLHGEAVAQSMEGHQKKSIAAGGTAEDAMLANAMNMAMIGKPPIGMGAHEADEYTEIESLDSLAEWMALTANPNHDIH